MAKIAFAETEDLPAVISLLEKNELPPDGLDEHPETVLVAREDGVVSGSAALELYGTAALLRSVCVREELRGRGLGRRLARAALDLAEERGATTIYLLTEGATGYFEPLGFRPVSRDEVKQAAPAVSNSVEFASACPVSAQAMALSTSEVQS